MPAAASPRHLLLPTLLALLPTAAAAGVLVPKEPGDRPLTLRKELIQVTVQDQVARATLDEVYENHTDHATEGTYLLPLPEGAAISGFATWVDGRRVESRVEEKQQAEKTYEEAKGTSQQPALLEKDAPNRFKTKVDGIPAQGTKRVEAGYAQILPYDSGLVTLRLPLATEGVQGQEPVGDFRALIDVSDQKKIADLKIAGAPGKVERVSPTSFRISLEGKDAALPKEILVTYRTESSRLGLTFATYRPDPNEPGYFLLLASPQELTTDADIVHKDVVFVFDTSGSMSGPKIEQARQGLQRCLSALGAQDRFGIVAFSDSLDPMRAELMPATPENVQEGLSFAQRLQASGGTNIHGALMRGFQMLQKSDRPRVVLMMTDGMPTAGVTDPEAIAAQVHQAAGNARLFTFGVGEDVNRVLLERLGRENRGGVDYVDGSHTIDEVVGGFYARISRPVLSDLSFKFGAVTTAMMYPDPLPDLYKGSQLVLVGRYRGGGSVHAALEGTLNGKRASLPFDATFPEKATADAFVARLWAQRRIDFLLAQNRLNGETDEARTEVIALSKQYQILTPYTAMVAAQPTMVAAVSPARVKPGDPTVRVRAPRDAKVRVFLPTWGEVKQARWSEDDGLWLARFLVPADTRDGTYPVKVEIDHADGRREFVNQTISIDTAAPAFAARAGAARAGRTVRLDARAVVGPVELATALLGRDDPAEALKALFDIRTVSARLWDGREVQLQLDPASAGFVSQVETNSDLKPGRYPVTFTAQDFAGNAAVTTAMVEIQP
ncbi:MAG TPA: VIT domain-containing protein [Myxococcaceae bacterium]|nr:VIT domain-containing protein [Myxococcaceae bacterium]